MSKRSSNSNSSSSKPPSRKSSKKLTIEELIKCEVCNEFPTSPIYSCKNGHILCAFCFEKVKTCGSCQEEYGPNGLAERLATKHHDIKKPCRNFKAGCSLLFESTKLYAHLRNCQFRPINCIEDYGVPCGGNEVYELKDFCSHLIEQHSVRLIKLIKQEKKDDDGPNGSEPHAMVATLDYCWNIDLMNTLTTSVLGKRLPISYLEFDGQVFLLHRRIDQGLVVWITLLGGFNENAQFKYTCKLTIMSKDPQPDDIEPIFIIPVKPIHGNYDVRTVKNTRFCAYVHPQILKQLSTLNGRKHEWKIALEMNKLQK